VVRPYADFAPTALEQDLDTFEQELDLLFDPAGKLALQRMPPLV
jgi:hypothetical protein